MTLILDHHYFFGANGAETNGGGYQYKLATGYPFTIGATPAKSALTCTISANHLTFVNVPTPPATAEDLLDQSYAVQSAIAYLSNGYRYDTAALSSAGGGADPWNTWTCNLNASPSISSGTATFGGYLPFPSVTFLSRLPLGAIWSALFGASVTYTPYLYFNSAGGTFTLTSNRTFRTTTVSSVVYPYIIGEKNAGDGTKTPEVACNGTDRPLWNLAGHTITFMGARVKNIRFQNGTIYLAGTTTFENCSYENIVWAGTGIPSDRSGSGDLDIGPFRLNGFGTFYSEDRSGAGALLVGPMRISGSGTFLSTEVHGAGDLDVGPFRLAGTGTFQATDVSGSGDLDIGPFSLAGTGTFTEFEGYTGTGALDVGPFSLAGTGTFTPQTTSAVAVTAVSTSPNLLTYRDAIEHLIDFFDGLPQEADQNRMRMAIQSAYREIAYARKWRYLQTHYRLRLSAPYSTGTITTSGNTVTLSGGTWPTWARYGHLVITGQKPMYRVAERTSASVLTLDGNFYPLTDVAGASYTLYRSTYNLPGDLWALETLIDEQNLSSSYNYYSDLMALERCYRTTGRPFQWTVTGSPDSYSQLCVMLYGYPAQAESLDFIYTRRPRMLRLDGYDTFSAEDGTRMVGVDSTGLDVQFSTDFRYEAAMAGAILRSGRPGTSYIPRGFGMRHGWWQQKVITGSSNTGTNYLTVDSALAGGWSEKYTISDPVDLAEYLHDAFLRSCEYHMLLKLDPAKALNHLNIVKLETLRAMERDSVVPYAGPAGPQFTHPAWTLLTGTITPSGG